MQSNTGQAIRSASHSLWEISLQKDGVLTLSCKGDWYYTLANVKSPGLGISVQRYAVARRSQLCSETRNFPGWAGIGTAGMKSVQTACRIDIQRSQGCLPNSIKILQIHWFYNNNLFILFLFTVCVSVCRICISIALETTSK